VRHYPTRRAFSRLAVLAFDLVLWPLAGRPCFKRRPRWQPIDISLAIFICCRCCWLPWGCFSKSSNFSSERSLISVLYDTPHLSHTEAANTGPKALAFVRYLTLLS